MNLLFIGNSYTFCNDLPAMICALAQSVTPLQNAQPTAKWTHTRYLQGGAALKTHVLDNLGVDKGRGEHGRQLEKTRIGVLTERLNAQVYDAVIVQGQSMDTVKTADDFFAYGKVLCDQIYAAGNPRIVLYKTWARENLPEMQDTIDLGYQKLATATKSQVAPVGTAWKLARARHPSIVLHTDDKSHPTVLGTYLTACVFLETLAGLDARTLPFEIEAIKLKIDPSVGKILQEIAHEVCAPQP